MNTTIFRKFIKALGNTPNLLRGYNLYVNPDKLRLIEHVFAHVIPQAHSFADLGGVWNVNAAYTRHSLKQPEVTQGLLVDTNYPQGLLENLRKDSRLKCVVGDFSLASTAETIGPVDVVYFFDVLLHQAQPDWDEVLALYAKTTSCIVIYNQQFVRGDKTVRLTDLPFEEYIALTSGHRYEFHKYVFEHKDEMHPEYHKRWGDIHNITQWGITDATLRSTMARLGFTEVYYANHGRFLDLPAFENHAFIFVKNGLAHRKE